MCDEILRHAVEGISDLITTPGLINIDFADIRTVMENAGSALMGIGSATGEHRAIEAAKAAINSPLLDVSITGAKGVLFSIAGGEDLTMFEVQDAAKVITESIDPEAKIIFGTVRDDKLKKNEVRVTVIATGFPESAATKAGGQASGTSAVGDAMLASAKAGDKAPVKERGKIFNVLSGGREAPAPAAADKAAEVRKDAVKPEANDDDDWGAVPAFLRRSRLK